MNELQRKEFEMLKIFIDICDQLGLKYFLVCGSALGAVKYGGFIPWDDDVDVALPRKDYEIFCEKAQELLPEYLFLQNYHTDKYYPLFMSKIRDSRTTYVETVYSKIPMHHGIYIDVFPLDGYPTEKRLIEKLEYEKILFSRRRLVRCNYNRFSKKNILHVKNIVLYIMFRLFGYCGDTQKVIERFDKIASSYDCYTSDVWCNHGNWQGKLEYAPQEQYGEGIMVQFEGLNVRVPKQYDAYLTQKYGDWRADLPVEQQKGTHNYSILDLYTPYTKYLDNK